MSCVLDFLRTALADGGRKAAPISEFRLLCSGELYNGKVVTADYRRTGAARRIMWGPFDLVVCSNAYDDYPQELVLAADEVTTGSDAVRHTFRPDGAVARDIAALLTVYARRLITVSGKVRTKYPDGIEGMEPSRDDWPEPIVGEMRKVAWPRRKAAVLYGPEGTEMQTHAPPPRAVDPGQLVKFLGTVVSMTHAGAYVASARHYALALELIEEKPEAAYQMLVVSAEALANEEYRAGPPVEKVLREKREVLRKALEMGLAEEQGKELALLACKGSYDPISLLGPALFDQL